jgi:hypothetical protein
MPPPALPSTSLFPSDPSGLERAELEAKYLELRESYKSLKISRGVFRSRSRKQSEQIEGQNLEQWNQSERIRELIGREAAVKARAYLLLEVVTEVMGHLEDAGDELSTSFGAFQLGKRRPGGSAYGGAAMPQLMKGVLHFLNRWRLGKQRFGQLMVEREALVAALEGADGRDH